MKLEGFYLYQRSYAIDRARETGTHQARLRADNMLPPGLLAEWGLKSSVGGVPPCQPVAALLPRMRPVMYRISICRDIREHQRRPTLSRGGMKGIKRVKEILTEHPAIRPAVS